MHGITVTLHRFPIGLLSEALIDVALARLLKVRNTELSGQAVRWARLSGSVVDEGQARKGAVGDTPQFTLTITSHAVRCIPKICGPDAICVVSFSPVAAMTLVDAKGIQMMQQTHGLPPL